MAYPDSTLPVKRHAAPSRLPPYGARTPATPARVVQPNYQALLGGDTALQGTLQGISAQGAQNQIGYDAARNAALIGYGSAPNADPVTQGLANQATTAGLSTLGQLQHDYHRAQSASIGNLLSRGSLHSGAYLQHARDNAYNLTRGTATAGIAQANQLAQLAQGQQTANQGLAQQGYEATSDALTRIIAQINAGLLPPTRQAAAPARLPNSAQVTRNSY